MALHQPNITELRLLENSIEGLKDIIGSVASGIGKKAVSVVEVSGKYDQRELYKQTGEVKYPFISLQLASISENKSGYNNQALYNGIPIFNIASTPDQHYEYRLLDILVTFNLTFACQSQVEVIEFAKRWLFRGREMQFKLVNEGFETEVKVEGVEQLTIPEQTLQEFGNIYELETVITMTTKTGEKELVKNIDRVAISSTLFNNSNQIIDSSTFVITKPRKGKITRTGN